jgi:hypothetical protein
MKKIIAFLNLNKLSLFQFALIGLGTFTVYKCMELSESTYYEIGTFQKYVDREYVEVGTDVSAVAGFNGGAVAFGLISCVCLYLIVLIELSKMKKN